MPASAEIQVASIERFIEGWRGWTPDGFLANWTEECSQTTLPFSAQTPIRTRAHTEKLFPVLMKLLTNFELTIHNVVHDIPHGKAVIYAFTKADTPFGPYRNEHALFLWLDESGEKVAKIEEMFDGVVMKEFLPKLEKYRAEQEAKA